MNLFIDMLTGESGQASVEYGLVIAFAVILALSAVIGTSNAIAGGVYKVILNAVGDVVKNIP